MLSFRQFITEAIDKRTLENLRKEALAFTKNLRRVKNGHDLYIAAQAYSRWIHYAEELIYNRIMGMRLRRKPVENETYEAKQVREKFWDLVISQNPFTLPNHYSVKLADIAIPGQKPTSFKYSDANRSKWDEQYALFDQQRDKIYVRYSRLIRDAFNAIDEWVAKEFKGIDTITDHEKVEHIRFDGVDVMLRWTERESNPTSLKNLKETFFHLLKKTLAVLRKYGFANHLTRVSWVFDPNNNVGSEAAGDYDSFRRVIGMYRFGIAEIKVYFHEFGHYVYREVLKQNQKKDWDAFITKDQVQFSDHDFVEIEKAISSTESANLDPTAERIHARIKDPVTQDLFAAFATQRYGIVATDISKFRSRAENVSFSLSVPTEYSNKNTEEAFCEVFGFFMAGKPLRPIIEAQFSRITGLRR